MVNRDNLVSIVEVKEELVDDDDTNGDTAPSGHVNHQSNGGQNGHVKEEPKENGTMHYNWIALQPN